ncbi:hypothetical protein EYV94_14830 [Puteibacter caeruleilacunae]|nr:hypothetical protein EYV94_14830 [Puteibacter caeruleilacunae]
MKNLLYLFLAITLASCGTKQANKDKAEKPTSMSVDKVYTDGEKYADQSITIEGTVIHVCRHGGERCFIMGTDEDQTIRIETNSKIKAFSQDQIGTDIKVKGTLRHIKIDATYLDNWEQEARDEEEATVEQRHLDGHEKHDGDHEHEEESELESTLEQINDYRAKIKELPKGYISVFYMDGEEMIK